jgi:penicillin-binding protein 2
LVKKIKNRLKKLAVKRTTVLMLFFAALFLVLINRLFDLQIIHGSEYAENFSVRITKQRTLKSTRGNIYDRNGNLLAYNELAYAVTLEDNGSYSTTRERNLTLNSVAYKVLQILKENGDSPDQNFHIILDENGNYAFDVSGQTLNRFRADVFGRARIEDLKEEEADTTAQEIIDHLCSTKSGCYALTNPDRPYTKEELEAYGLPAEFTKEEVLEIVSIRYTLSTNSFQKYLSVNIATDVSEKTVSAIMENKGDLQGVDIAEETKRVYVDGEYFASVIGYTGKASTDELEDLQEQSGKYSNTSIVGKAGIEQYMEVQLQGTDGSENVYVDNLGKVLQIDEDSIVQPQAGNDVYLTLDKELQIAAYKLLEQKIAGIVIANIVSGKTFDKTAVQDASDIRIPIYDVYYALINNSVIDIEHFNDIEASSTERELYARFLEKQEAVFAQIREELTGSSPVPYENLSSEMQEYLSYIVTDYLMNKKGILSSEAIDTSDATYEAWTKEGSISLQEFLTYAVSQNWIDISKIELEGEYLDSKEVYNALADYLAEYLANDTAFSKLLYKYMLLSDMISGTQICVVLYDQGVLSTDDGDYEGLLSGQTPAYNFMIRKLSNLEITPAQLALDPCSGSLVATDPNTGEVLVCVSYPGYDNNRLSNQMDTAYWNQLVTDLSEPLYNKATQQKTAPGSTFKIVTAVAGVMENLSITQQDNGVVCNGVFDKVNPPINCWYRAGHGWLDLEHAIKDSCNVYFSQVAYDMGLDSNGVFSETTALQKLSVYAQAFDLDKNSGIEISEAAPQVSDDSAIRSAFGQGTHAYTTSQLARYVSTIANSGTSYNISLLDKVTDSEGNILEDYTPSVQSTLELSQDNWDRVHRGMRMVIQNHSAFMDLDLPVAGKTGTAQMSKTRPDHGLFMGYAPFDNPEIAVAVRIAFGYSSANAASTARDFFSYAFEVEDEATLLTGTAKFEDVSTEQTD